jgi:hypothetical protein
MLVHRYLKPRASDNGPRWSGDDGLERFHDSTPDTLMRLVLIALLELCAAVYSLPTSRTVPPHAAVIVRGSGTQPGEFSTIQAAVTSLPADNSAQAIFVYPGTYLSRLSWAAADSVFRNLRRTSASNSYRKPDCRSPHHSRCSCRHLSLDSRIYR